MIEYIDSTYIAMLSVLLKSVVIGWRFNTWPMFIMARMQKANANLTEKQSCYQEIREYNMDEIVFQVGIEIFNSYVSSIAFRDPCD